MGQGEERIRNREVNQTRENENERASRALVPKKKIGGMGGGKSGMFSSREDECDKNHGLCC